MLYITLRQLEYVLAISRSETLSEAATALHVSQPSLTIALQQVEDRLGQKLFTRGRGKAVTATPAGVEFLRQAGDILARASALENPAPGGTLGTRLALGVFEDLAPFCLAPALRLINAALPNLDITYSVTGFADLARQMQGDTIDLAITYDLGLDSGFIRQNWATIAPSAFMSPDHPLASNPGVSLSDLADKPLILFEEGLSIRHMLSLFRASGLAPHIRHRAQTLEVLRSLAANGHGIGISYATPPTSLSYDAKPLVARPITDSAAREPVILARPRLGSASETAAQVATLLAASDIFAAI